MNCNEENQPWWEQLPCRLMCSKMKGGHLCDWKTSPESGTDLCPGCRNLPQIRGTFMPGVQKPASDSRDISARGAETCLRFKAHLCPVCRNLPQIQGTFMHGVQKPASDSGHIYARCAETCLRFEGHFCPVCRNMPQIQGTFMHGVHDLPQDLRQRIKKQIGTN